MPGSWSISYLLLATACCGCGVDELSTPAAAKLKGLASCYMDYAVTNGGKGPADEKTFKKHLRAMQGFQLEMYSLDPDDIDGAFVAERDQQPLVVYYSRPISLGLPNPGILIHEKSGKNGKWLVGLASGEVELVDEGRLKELTE